MEAGAVEADENTEAGRGPGRVFGVAVEAGLVFEPRAETLQDGRRVLRNLISGGRGHRGEGRAAAVPGRAERMAEVA